MKRIVLIMLKALSGICGLLALSIAAGISFLLMLEGNASEWMGNLPLFSIAGALLTLIIGLSGIFIYRQLPDFRRLGRE